MKKLLKKISCIFIILSTFSACQSVKDGLTAKKKTNSDEFLVQKKNPLSLPPDFSKLPEPRTLNKNDDQNNREIDLKDIITKNPTRENTMSTDKISGSSLEKSILEKIKSN
jgi:hypothetical protein